MKAFFAGCLICLTLILTVTAGAFYYGKHMGVFQISLEKLQNWQPKNNTKILDRHGNLITEVFAEDQIFVPLEEIPPFLIQAIIAIEDKNFWTHPGVDFLAIGRALWAHITKKPFQQGASTITQQIVREFILTKEKTMTRKIKEAFLAIRLEKLLTKKDILEIYLNGLFLGHGAYGVGAASKRYFGKPLIDLNPEESAVIAGLFQAPSKYNPKKNPHLAKKRQLQVLRAMKHLGFLKDLEYELLKKTPLVYSPYQGDFGQKAPYFVDFVKDEALRLLHQDTLKNQGLKIVTALDSDLQEMLETALKKEQSKQKLWDTVPSLEVAALALDHRTGEILSMIGGKNYQTSQFNRATQAKRQPGSSFKPIVYSLALEQGFEWNHPFLVMPISLPGKKEGETYEPKSNRSEYGKETTMFRAFYRSINGPVIELGEILGLKQVLEHGKLLGFQGTLKNEYGTLLGASETSPLNMAEIYGVFANQGRSVPPSTSILRILDDQDLVLYEKPMTESHQLISETVASLMIEGLRGGLLYGTASMAQALAPYAVGKTGTSNEGKDNWFCGFTQNLTLVVWIGDDFFQPLGEEAYGASLALPIWMDFMEQFIEQRRPKKILQHHDLYTEKINPNFGTQDPKGIPMWFLKQKQNPAAQTLIRD